MAATKIFAILGDIGDRFKIDIPFALLNTAKNMNLDVQYSPEYMKFYLNYIEGENDKTPLVYLKQLSDLMLPEQTLTLLLKELVSIDFDKNVATTPWMVKQNKDDLKGISNWRFPTEAQAGLAAIMWLNIAEHKRNQNDFKHQFKHVLRILEVSSIWSK